MNRIALALALVVAACGDVQTAGDDQPDDVETGDDAPGDPPCVGDACEPIVCGGLQCGSFGTCAEAGDASTCQCNSGMTGTECDACAAPTANLVWDTFGGAGQHHTIGINPGDTVVAMLPSLPVTSNGPQIVGNLSFAQVPYTPDGKYTVVFSRCPGDVSELARKQNVNGASPCGGDFLARTGRVDWRESGAPNMSQCYLPPSDGPWYANIRVDPAAVTACQQEVGRQCVINWQWN